MERDQLSHEARNIPMNPSMAEHNRGACSYNVRFHCFVSFPNEYKQKCHSAAEILRQVEGSQHPMGQRVTKKEKPTRMRAMTRAVGEKGNNPLTRCQTAKSERTKRQRNTQLSPTRRSLGRQQRNKCGDRHNPQRDGRYDLRQEDLCCIQWA